jgi:F-type H+-transporting ATPase subunit a
VNRKEIYFIFRKEVVQMDALVEGLMEELNCETVFTIPLFGGIPVYESVVVTWIIMAVVFLLCILLSRNLSVENPSRRQVVVETAIKGLNDFFTETVGEKGKAYIPYLSAIAIYIGIANLIGLLGFKPPTKDMNVCLSFFSYCLSEEIIESLYCCFYNYLSATGVFHT